MGLGLVIANMPNEIFMYSLDHNEATDEISLRFKLV